ncbi:MAG: hypothetical protein PVI82_14115, partial [Desulfobacterales bacterium]
FFIEANSPLGTADHQIYEKIKTKPVFVVLNKIDLIRNRTDTAIPDNWAYVDLLRISALYDQGLDHLRDKILKWAGGENPVDLTEAVVPNLRHKLLLEKALTAAETINEELQKETSTELVAIHLQEAIDALGEITGDYTKLDVLDQIFSRFCIGK